MSRDVGSCGAVLLEALLQALLLEALLLLVLLLMLLLLALLLAPLLAVGGRKHGTRVCLDIAALYFFPRLHFFFFFFLRFVFILSSQGVPWKLCPLGIGH